MGSVGFYCAFFGVSVWCVCNRSRGGGCAGCGGSRARGVSGWRGACGRGQGWVWGRLEVSPKLSLLAHAPCWCGDGEGAPGQGILLVFSVGFFPPCSNAAEQGGAGGALRGGAGSGWSSRGGFEARTDGRTDVLLLSLSFACQPCGCLPAPDPSRGCSPLPGLPLRALARSKRPRCPRLSPALPEPRSPSRWCGVCVMGGSRMVSWAGCLDRECFRM